MSRTDAADASGNIFMKTEDRFQEWRAQRRLESGYLPLIQGFLGYGGSGWVRVLARVVVAPKQDPHLAALEAASKVARDTIRGWRNFVNPPLPDAKVTIEIGGRAFEATADRGGVIDAMVEVDLEPGWHTVILSEPMGHRVETEVRIVDEAMGLGVVSDIDDTVMVTLLPRPMLAAWNTFITDEHARNPTPGMSVLLDRITRNEQVGFFTYLSTGPWNVAGTLKRFMARNLYPKAPVLLTDWGPTPTRFFRSGVEHKKTQLTRLAKEFPDLQWVLIGDDGQHDESIYAWFQQTHPGRVKAVAIRQLNAAEAVLAGGRSQHAKAPKAHQSGDVPWFYAPDGAGLARQFAELGMIEDGNSSTEDFPDNFEG